MDGMSIKIVPFDQPAPIFIDPPIHQTFNKILRLYYSFVAWQNHRVCAPKKLEYFRDIERPVMFIYSYIW
jgi:hypothetical protein